MLVLSRKVNESIVINDEITVTILNVRGNRVIVGVEAPPAVSIVRKEIYSSDRPQASPSRVDPKPE